MVFLEHMAARLVKYVARYAAGLDVDENDLRRITGSSAYPVMREAVYVVAKTIVTEKNGLPRCNICGRGPYTKRGLYLHLMRVHRDYIRELVRRALEEKLLETS